MCAAPDSAAATAPALHPLVRALAYVWAAPWTAVGLACGLIALLFGARARVHRGAFEFSGGLLGRAISRLPARIGFAAITVGHVILAASHDVLEPLRDHEHVHVRQYERWGVFFIPAYALSSLWQAARGRGLYHANHFEREARALADVARLDRTLAAHDATERTGDHT